jgi:GTPase SAR1 family protein
MNNENILKYLAKRGNGDIYLGVVGAVRTGKSTFIKKVIENLIVPNIDDEIEKKRYLDEIPQSAQGKTIMTTEPKFVPSNGAKIKVEGFTAKSISRVQITKSGIGTSHRISILCMNDKNIPTDAEIVIIDKGMKVMKTKKGVLNYDVNLNNDEEERIIKISVPSCINFLQREHKIRIRNLN